MVVHASNVMSLTNYIVLPHLWISPYHWIPIPEGYGRVYVPDELHFIAYGSAHTSGLGYQFLRGTDACMPLTNYILLHMDGYGRVYVPDELYIVRVAGEYFGCEINTGTMSFTWDIRPPQAKILGYLGPLNHIFTLETVL